MQTPPDLTPEGRYLETVAACLREAIGSPLVGVYAGGSYALGDYLRGRSDLDVAAVMRGSLSLEAADAVVGRLRHEALPCPARQLELVVYGDETAASGRAGSAFELNLNTGEGIRESVQSAGAAGDIGSHWFAIDRSILADAGVALLGPPAGKVFAAIPPEELRSVLLESIHWYRTHAADPSDAVLNACRALSYAKTGRWSPKPDAGVWAAQRSMAPRQLVSLAIAARSRPGELEPGEVTGFLRSAESQLRRERT